MTSVHFAGKMYARSSLPMASRSRAMISFHVHQGLYPEDEIDKVRFIQNEDVPGNLLETLFPEFEFSGVPVSVDARNAREAYVNSWINGDKEIDERDETVTMFATSIKCGFADGVVVDELPSFPGSRKYCFGAYKLCNYDPVTAMEINSKNDNVTRIPACMSKYTNLKELWLNSTYVSKIENLDKNTNLELLDLNSTPVNKIENLDKNMKLKKIRLDKTPVSRIENLENNVELKGIWLDGTKVSRIENLDTLVNLKDLGLIGTKVSKIENLEHNTKLEKLWLNNTKVSRIENLDNLVNLKEIGLSDTDIPEDEHDAFEALKFWITVL